VKKATRPTPAASRSARVLVQAGNVSAACFAPATGEVFLGYSNGDVHSFQPWHEGRVPCLLRQGGPVWSLATDAEGRFLAVVYGPPGRQQLAAYLREADGTFRFVTEQPVEGPGEAWLARFVVAAEAYFVGLWQGTDFKILLGPLLTPETHSPVAEGQEPAAALFLPAPPAPGGPPYYLALLAGDMLTCAPLAGRPLGSATLGWTPIRPKPMFRPAPVSCLRRDSSHLELAGVDGEGHLCWSLVQIDAGGRPEVQGTNVRAGPYLAAAVVRPGLVVGVGPGRTDWLRIFRNGFTNLTVTPVAPPRAVMCFPSHRTRELLVVCSDGYVVRVPEPQ
jgi:hypothetical protein